MSLLNSTIKGFSWSFIEQSSNKLLQLAIGIILARLLSPAEFGLIGMLTIFISISEGLAGGGFIQALIRKKDCTEGDYNTAFLFNIGISFLLYTILFFSAPLISDFYNEPILTKLVRVFGIVILIDSASLVQRAQLIKLIDFRKIASISVISNLLGGGFGIWAAFSGFGVWSLVIKVISSRGIQSLLLWIYNRWIPNFIFDKSSFREMFSFGSRLLANNMIERIFKNIYFVIIGKVFSASDLGFYTRANQFKNLLSEQTLTLVQRVTLPALAKIQDNEPKFRSVFQRLLNMVTFISFPLIILLIVVAKPFIITLIGEKWLPSVLYLQLLAGTAFFYPIGELNINVLQVKGRSDLILKLQYIRKIFIIPVVLIGVFVGIIPMLISMIFYSMVEFFLSSSYSGRFINYSSLEQFTNMLKIAIIPAIVGGGVYILGMFLSSKPWIELIVLSLTYAILLIGVFEITKNSLYTELKSIVKKGSFF